MQRALRIDSDGRQQRLALFALGLRPFFLLAGVEAVVAMAVWLAAFLYPDLWPSTAIPAWLWHAHEMLFGFVTAAIGGFLLTAVPGWTGGRAVSGLSLVVLVAIWLAGRVAMAPLPLPPLLSVLLDLLFLPSLLCALVPPLVRSAKWRNFPFVPVLLVLFLCDAIFQAGRLGIVPMGELIGLGIALDVVTILVVIIGGRVIPAFTRSGLARRRIEVDIPQRDWLDALAIAAVTAVLAGDLTAPHSALSGIVALVAAAVLALRLSLWHGYRAMRVPLVWILHLGYAWIVVGLALKGLAITFAWQAASQWLHAFTAGAFATMILAIMSRASLGHTGRSLVAPPPVVLAYAVLTSAATLRVFGPLVVPQAHDAVILLAGVCWIVAFALFLWVYAPMLARPRADGRPAR